MTKVSVFVSEKRPTKRSMHSDADFMLPGNRFVAIALPDSCTRTIKAFVSALLSQSVLSRRRDSTRYSGEARRGEAALRRAHTVQLGATGRHRHTVLH